MATAASSVERLYCRQLHRRFRGALGFGVSMTDIVVLGAAACKSSLLAPLPIC
jgi:hypothetical protein